jgi:hypothetical protein
MEGGSEAFLEGLGSGTEGEGMSVRLAM